jgi:hypothetical protein
VVREEQEADAADEVTLGSAFRPWVSYWYMLTDFMMVLTQFGGRERERERVMKRRQKGSFEPE